MAYISDRQRVEIMLLPVLAYAVVQAGAEDPKSELVKEACDSFQSAVVEAIRLTDDKKKRNLSRRVLRLSEEVIDPYAKEGGRVDKVGLILYNLLNWILNSGYLELHSGSNMDKGLELLLPGLERAAGQERLSRSARRAAEKILKALQAQGYFESVTIQ